MNNFTEWSPVEAKKFIAVPRETDDKYSRGVLGIITGSDDFPGAAVIGVDSALHTGVGMVRYLGSARSTDLVLRRRPEAVAVDGRVQAWLLGSGMDDGEKDPLTTARLTMALSSGHPLVLDAGCIPLCERAEGHTVLTPHLSELARVLHADAAEISAEPELWAERAAHSLNSTVLLKGHTTLVSGPGGNFHVTAPTTWLATAGTGDSLAGILGALVATHVKAIADDPGILAPLAATAAIIHGRAAERAGGGGPFTVLDLNAQVPGVIAALVT